LPTDARDLAVALNVPAQWAARGWAGNRAAT
jgi:hypothetical protein